MITKTLSLKVLRPYWGEAIEQQIRRDKEQNKKKGGKGILDNAHYDKLKKDQCDVDYNASKNISTINIEQIATSCS